METQTTAVDTTTLHSFAALYHVISSTLPWPNFAVYSYVTSWQSAFNNL